MVGRSVARSIGKTPASTEYPGVIDTWDLEVFAYNITGPAGEIVPLMLVPLMMASTATYKAQ